MTKLTLLLFLCSVYIMGCNTRYQSITSFTQDDPLTLYAPNNTPQHYVQHAQNPAFDDLTRHQILDKAIYLLDRVVLESPTDTSALQLRGDVHLSLGQYESALQSYEQACPPPVVSCLHEHMGIAYQMTNDYSSAIKAYGIALAAWEDLLPDRGAAQQVASLAARINALELAMSDTK